MHFIYGEVNENGERTGKILIHGISGILTCLGLIFGVLQVMIGKMWNGVHINSQAKTTMMRRL